MTHLRLQHRVPCKVLFMMVGGPATEYDLTLLTCALCKIHAKRVWHAATSSPLAD